MPLAAKSRGRISFDEMFILICDIVAERSTCLKSKSGCLIVRDGMIVALGYNGAPKGMSHCSVLGCLCEDSETGSGQGKSYCRGVHAEQNALIQAGIAKTRGATLYSNRFPCPSCIKLIVQAEIERVVFSGEDRQKNGMNLLKQAGIEVVQMEIRH